MTIVALNKLIRWRMPTSTSAATVPMNEVIMHGSITSAGFSRMLPPRDN